MFDKAMAKSPNSNPSRELAPTEPALLDFTEAVDTVVVNGPVAAGSEVAVFPELRGSDADLTSPNPAQGERIAASLAVPIIDAE